MAGKMIPLFTYGVEQGSFDKLCGGMQRISGDWIRCFDLGEAPPVDVAFSEACIAAGITASEMAKEIGYKRIYKIPDVVLFIDEPSHPGLGKLVVKHLNYVMAVEIESSTTSPSIPTTSQRSTPSVDEDAPIIDPKDSGFKLPKEGLSMEEIKNLFQEQYSQEEPFVFMSGRTEIAIYPDNPPGKRSIEFSVDEFYTILKLVEITKAKGIVWRERSDANPK